MILITVLTNGLQRKVFKFIFKRILKPVGSRTIKNHFILKFTEKQESFVIKIYFLYKRQ